VSRPNAGSSDFLYERGEPDRALADAPVKAEQTYTIPVEHHNPMEMHATVAVWDGPRLTL
jgi:xanthine dehydrogenase YagR molybdenum-binding subunit